MQLSTLALQLIAAAALRGVAYNERDLIAQLHGHKSIEDLRKAVGSMPPERLTTLLLDCALVDDVIVEVHHPRKPDGLLTAAKHYGVDVTKIRKEVEALPKDTKTPDLLQLIGEATLPPDPAGARPQDAQSETTKGRGPKGRGSKDAPLRKPRLSAKDAKQGIAAAMQGIDGAGASTPAQGDLVDAAARSEEDQSGAADAAQSNEASAATALANVVNWPPFVQLLQERGITTREQLADLDVDELVTITGQEREAAGALIMRAREGITEGAAA